MSGPRVLFVTHNYPRHSTDAAGSFLHRLALALRAGGCEIHVLTPSAPGLPREETLDGVSIRRFRYAPSGMESLAYTGTMAEQVLGTLRGKAALAGLLTVGTMAVRRAIEEVAPDLVHAHWWFPSGLLALGADREVPVITTMHGSDVRLARKVKYVHPLFRRVMRRSAAVTAVSGWLAGEARAMAPKANIEVAPMPADTGLFTAKKTPRLPGRFLFVGRLNDQKGAADLLEALSWAPQCTVDIVGEGELRDALRRRADALGVADRVHWHPAAERQALPDLFRRSLAVVMPSREEGLGLVAVEAQLCATPVIAYKSGGLTDIVSHEWAGVLVPTGDTRAMADAMTRFAERPERSDADGTTARAAMVDRFSPSAVAANYRGLYEAVLSERN
ncbi:MAG: glycosyltransferase [Gemmatimonadaceae bacterium]|nr:glycosyltransferase [Gemmatimonadaceae bacterium]